MNSQAMQHWLQLHLRVLDLEAGLATLASQVAAGTEPAARLQVQQQVVEATRQTCIAAYSVAFPT